MKEINEQGFSMILATLRGQITDVNYWYVIVTPVIAQHQVPFRRRSESLQPIIPPAASYRAFLLETYRCSHLRFKVASGVGAWVTPEKHSIPIVSILQAELDA